MGIGRRQGRLTSTVFIFDGDDPEMQHASQEARATFGYFWRELAWERRRIDSLGWDDVVKLLTGSRLR